MATLVVVLVLFFVVSLAAAYASRNLIFEQRTSANQLKSTQSMEAAEAGVEWAVSMLNGGRIGDDCLPTGDVTRDSFRQRYLSLNTGTGVITPKLSVDVWAACALDASNSWQCKCPTTSAQLTATSLPVAGPAFSVRFVEATSPSGMGGTRAGLVRVEVNGCSSYDLECVKQVNGFDVSKCQSLTCAVLGLYNGIKSQPAAAITALGQISGALTVSNTFAPSGGITLQAAGTADPSSADLTTLPGTPPNASVRGTDAGLLALEAETNTCDFCLFSSLFGLRPQTYQQQQAVLALDCSTACTGAAIQQKLETDNVRRGSFNAAKGGILWLRSAGGLNITSASEVIGSATDPVILIIDGPLTIASTATASAKIYGLVYASQNVVLNGGEIVGAIASAGNVSGTNGQVTYDAAVLDLAKKATGSFVRMPGGWRDFP